MTIIDLFKNIVDSYPEKPAIKSEHEGIFSYKELDLYSNYIASKLLKSTLSHKIVGLSMNRSFSMIAAMIGVLKSGMAYVPIDPDYPEHRINYMINNSSISIIICSQEIYSSFKHINCKSIIIDEVFYSNEAINLSKEKDLAFVLYTSGSTRLPNGVMISHQSIMNTLIWRINYYSLNHNSCNIQIPSFSSASSLEDVFSTLLCGGTLIIINTKDLMNVRYLKYLIIKYSVNHLLLVPTLYTELLPKLSDINSLKMVVIAGEKASQRLIQMHFEYLPFVTLYIEYGMTETSVGCMIYHVKNPLSLVYLGNPINNMNYFISSDNYDTIGELLISGVGLAEGYHNNIEATKEKFIYHNKVRYFKTGDFVKKYDDGNIEYIGRKDNQLKINGQRINLSEIDYVLQKDFNVENSITVGASIDSRQFIISFIKTKMSDDDYFFKLTRTFLPKYYIPDYFCLKSDFVYLPNKKINVKRMKEMFTEDLLIEKKNSSLEYKKVVEILKNVTHGKVLNPQYDTDIRNMPIDSIGFIKFLAHLEEEFEFEFGYDDIDNFKVLSIDNLISFILELKNNN